MALAAFAFGVRLDRDRAPRVEVAGTLPLSQLAGERIVAGFSGSTLPRPIGRAIRAGQLAGIILFADNLSSRAGSRRLIARMQAIHRPPFLHDPLLIMVDQEGGLVKRIGGAPTASAQQMGAARPGFSLEQGRHTAASLRGLGINVDLAPVLDVARPGGTIAETERGFGGDARQVSDTAIPFAEALQQGGVAAAAKHFPGLGAAPIDTDFAVQRIGLSAQTLREVDEAPYRPFAEFGGEMVMLSSAIYPAFSKRPAAFSRPIATGELRNRIGFKGVSITDALETVSVKSFGGPAKVAVAAARAGTDLLLFTDLDAAQRGRRALLARLRNGSLSREEFQRSAQRVLDLRRRSG